MAPAVCRCNPQEPVQSPAIGFRRYAMAKPKVVSRVQRWSDAAGQAFSALEELKDIQFEYEEWRDNLPENLQQSAVGEKLETVCQIDLESAMSAVQEAEDADLPLGFGRD
jgi:hypothetical protein